MAGAPSPASAAQQLGGALPLLLLGLLFHATYLASIFDIYFVSPVVHVDRRYSALAPLPGDSPDLPKPLADRVVFIVGDGLRADKLFNIYPNPPFPEPISLPDLSVPSSILSPYPPSKPLGPDEATPAPYLRSLLDSGEASWGVSHTRVPTESRPGHVALIAGMYEDVSAVTRGWKLNPVNFDSLFNQSSHTFSFGSPDILPMFSHGASPPAKVSTFCYDGSDEDFTRDAVELDLWVLDSLSSLLTSARHNETLTAQLQGRGVFFFLHLLGLDTTGHSYRPHGPEYFRNIAVLDRVVHAAESLLSRFYGDDGRTAFVFTADHGMSNIGNHGDGDPANTRTPLVAWGSGVARNSKASEGEQGQRQAESERDGYFRGWRLEDWQRKDVEQADVATLMASLAGINVPGNSVGKLPVDYLDATPEQKARAAFASAREVLEQYRVKHELKAARTWRYRSFPELPTQEPVKPVHLPAEQRTFWISRLIQSGRYAEAIEASSELEAVALKGLRYLQTYDWFLLRTVVVAGYIGWMLYSASFLLRTYAFPQLPLDPSDARPPAVTPAFVALGFLLLSARFWAEGAPLTYYGYAGFAAWFWGSVLADPGPFAAAWSAADSPAARRRALGSGALAWGLLECMAAGYFRRAAWTVGWGFLGWGWPALGMDRGFRRRNAGLLRLWGVLTCATGVFTLLPVETGENLTAIMAGGGAFVVAHLLAKRRGLPAASSLQIALLLASMATTLTAALRIRAKLGLPRWVQACGWAVCCAAVLSARRAPGSGRGGGDGGGPRRLEGRIVGLVYAFAPVLVILSLSYEVLFYFSFSATLLVWLELETRLAGVPPAPAAAAPAAGPPVRLRLAHCRLALCFLFYIHVGFFGTGNVASVSSFRLEPVYRLAPVFAPFLMAALLLCKLAVPFLAVSAAAAGVHRRLALPRGALLVAALTASDVLTLRFFFLVTDRGSWLEIGRSISHFCIAGLLLVFVVLLHLVGELVLRESEPGPGVPAQKSD